MEPREIRSSRLKFVVYLAISLAFVAVGLLRGTEGLDAEQRNWVWFSLLFFSLCSLVFVWMLVRPQRLLLDREGFTLAGGLVRSPKKVLWEDVDQFFTCRLPRGGTLIGYNFRPGARVESVLIKVNRGLGAEAALPKGWPKSPEEMVQDLNDYRAQALSRKS